MSRLVQVSVDGGAFRAAPGERLLDAALVAGADIPHECRSGQCGTCRVRVVEGHVLGGQCGVPGCVLACQAVVLSDTTIEVERAPPVVEVEGVVERIDELARDVVELTIATAGAFAWYPGQYASIGFEGYPARCFSPTVALDGSDRPGTFRLHVKRLTDGVVSSALGVSIQAGHRVSIEGPYGSAWLRPQAAGRLVLFAGGTGFAPIWAIADAALSESFGRKMVIIAGVRSIYSLYMAQALERLTRVPSVTVVPLTSEPQSIAPVVATGSPADLGSVITADDTVHAAGPPGMVEALARAAEAAGAVFHADPFVPSGEAAGRTLLSTLAERFGVAGAGSRRRPVPIPTSAAPLGVR